MSKHEFALQYTAVGVAPYKRNATHIAMREFIEFDVPEVDHRDAPVGAVIKSEYATEELRYYDGRWFMRDWVADPEMENAGQVRTLGGFGVEKDYQNKKSYLDMAKHSLFESQRFSHYEMKNCISRREARVYQEGEFREIHSISRDHEYAKLAALVEAKTISIEGEMYTEVPEPFFVFEFTKEIYGSSYMKKYRKPENVKLSIVFGEPEFKEDQKVFVFAVDQQDEVNHVVEYLARIEQIEVKIDMSAEMHLGIGITSSIEREKKEFISEISTWVKHDTEDMRKWDRAQINTYLDFRDAFRAAKKAEFTDEALGDVSEKLRDYGNFMNLGPYTRMVIDRWDQRPINLDIDLDQLEDNSLSM